MFNKIKSKSCWGVFYYYCESGTNGTQRKEGDTTKTKTIKKKKTIKQKRKEKRVVVGVE